MARDLAYEIDDPYSKSNALSAIASAAGQLEDATEARTVLEQALTATESIDEPNHKSYALRAIASAYEQLPDADVAQNLLVQIRQVTERVGASDVLSQIAANQAMYGDWYAALRTLRTCLEGDKVNALAAILTHYAESKTPQHIDGPVVLAVNAIPEASGQYTLSVTLQSPDEDCKRHADWWEVLSEEGELLSRHLVDTPHGFEQLFTTEKTLALGFVK